MEMKAERVERAIGRDDAALGKIRLRQRLAQWQNFRP
jgi:hypothetical protein